MARKRTSAPSDSVVINDVGPIEHLEIKAPTGKIVVLTGRNGAGKTKALEAIDALAGGKSKIESRDGTTGGFVEGFGIRISVARGGSNRRRGELEVTDLEDKLRIAELIDPGLKDPLAADERRIKSLVRLSGKRADFELFRPVLDDQWQGYVSEETMVEKDVVDMAARLKRDIERKARDIEKQADHLEAEMDAKFALLDDIDVTQPHERDVLAAELESAFKAHTVLCEQRMHGIRVKQLAEQSKASIEKSIADSQVRTVLECELAYATAHDARAAAAKKIIDLEQQLRDAQHELDKAELEAGSAHERLLNAREWDLMLDKWRADVEAAANVECPDEDALSEAEEMVQLARMANDQGVRIRDALKQKADGDALAKTRDDLRKYAEKLRDAAGGTNDVLTRLVSEMGCDLKVNREFRLVLKTERGETYYADLSHGERTRTAIDIVIGTFEESGTPGLLCIPQELFEGLDADNVFEIRKQIEGRPITIFTAVADHGDEVRDEVGVSTLE